jgi:hypothetical protein
MAEDEFFKRIAETEQPTEPRPSDRPIGTAGRRGLSATAEKTVHRAQAEQDEEHGQEEPKALVEDHPKPVGPSARQRCAARIRRAVARIKSERKRITAVAAVGLGVALATAIVVVAFHSVGGRPASTAHSEDADRLLSQLAAVRADQRAMSKALASERAARRLELGLTHSRQRRGGKHDRSGTHMAPVATVPVPQASPVGTQESFGFERPSP